MYRMLFPKDINILQQKNNIMKYPFILLGLFFSFVIFSCKNNNPDTGNWRDKQSSNLIQEKPHNLSPEGMVWIPGGEFKQGAQDSDQDGYGS